MKYKEYAIKENGVFHTEEGPHWGTVCVTAYTRKEALDYIKNRNLIDWSDGEKPKLELYEHDVECKFSPWRKSVKKGKKRGK